VTNSLKDALASATTLLAAADSKIEDHTDTSMALRNAIIDIGDHTDTSMALRNALLEATGYKNAIQVHESFLQSISSHVVNYTEAFKKHTQRQR
jgi:outer membrane lipopolysaccharide assembly protein LptE/RlpB